MKVSYLIILVLSALFGTCICMDGFFNSSDFDAMDEEFGIWLRFFCICPSWFIRWFLIWKSKRWFFNRTNFVTNFRLGAFYNCRKRWRASACQSESWPKMNYLYMKSWNERRYILMRILLLFLQGYLRIIEGNRRKKGTGALKTA